MSLESNCLIPVVHLESDTLETEGLNLLVGDSYVDTILTTLPVRLAWSHSSPFLSIISSLKLCKSKYLDFWLFFLFLGSCRSCQRKSRMQLLPLLLIHPGSMVRVLLYHDSILVDLMENFLNEFSSRE